MKSKMKVRDLNLWYGDFQGLKDINMDIYENQIIAFIGPSGSGKSSFIKTLNRMNDLVEGARVEGSIELDGKDIYSSKTDVNVLRKRVGMVFQHPNPFPRSEERRVGKECSFR